MATVQTVVAVLLTAPLISWGMINSYLRIHELEEHASYVARHDRLTGLLNRGAFFEEIGESLYSENNESFALMIIDLDFFKRVNDEHGHIAGDAVLEIFGHVLTEVCDHYDAIPCRFGGEEFLVYIKNGQSEIGLMLDQELRHRLAMNTIQLDNSEYIIKYSAGISINRIVNAETSIDDSILDADNALYKAKQKGRNQTIISG